MPVSANDAYAAKAAFFDTQVDTDWASRPYGPEKRDKLDRLFTATGDLNGLRVLEPGCGTGRLTALLAGFDNVEILQGPVEEKIGADGGFIK